MKELNFLVEDALEGGYSASVIGASIFTEAETMDGGNKGSRLLSL